MIARNGFQHKARCVFVPRGVDFSRFGKNAAGCKALMGYLYSRTLQPQQGFCDWVGIPRQTQARLLGRYYPVVRDACIADGLLDYAARYGYARGHHCRHFRLGRRLWHRDWIAEPTEPIAWHLDAWPEAYRYAAESAMSVEVLDIPQNTINQAVASAFAKKPREISLEELTAIYQQQVKCVRHAMICPVMDDYGRLHTPVTSLPKAFRRFLTLDGEPLGGVDIASSQPLFLGLAVQESALRGSGSGVFTDAQQGISIEVDVVDGSVGSDGVAGTAVGRWLRLCCEADFYTSFRDELGLKVSRDQFKSKLFAVLYGPNLTDGRKRGIMRFLRDEFPEIFEYMFSIKEVPRLRSEWARLLENQSYPKAWEAFRREFRPVYGKLACEMQRTEASFIFGRVIPRLQELGVPAVTIHDSVLAPRSKRATVQEVMADEFRKLCVQAQLHEIDYGVVDSQESGGDVVDSPARGRSSGGRVRRERAARGAVPTGAPTGTSVAA